MITDSVGSDTVGSQSWRHKLVQNMSQPFEMFMIQELKLQVNLKGVTPPPAISKLLPPTGFTYKSESNILKRFNIHNRFH